MEEPSRGISPLADILWVGIRAAIFYSTSRPWEASLDLLRSRDPRRVATASARARSVTRRLEHRLTDRTVQFCPEYQSRYHSMVEWYTAELVSLSGF